MEEIGLGSALMADSPGTQKSAVYAQNHNTSK